VNLKEMFQQMTQVTGIVLNPQFQKEKDLDRIFQLKRVVSESDIVGMEPVAKQPTFLVQSGAISLWQYSQFNLNKEEKYKMLLKCIDIILLVKRKGKKKKVCFFVSHPLLIVSAMPSMELFENGTVEDSPESLCAITGTDSARYSAQSEKGILCCD
jgi:hypothetical protein